MNTSTTQNADSPDRPIGYWLKAADRLMAAEFAAAFENEGITRRDWRLLNVVDGTARTERRLPAHKLGRLSERGWVARTDDGWTLTDEGRAAKERLAVIVDGIRIKAADAVSADDYATTIATLQQIAEAYGWEEGIELPRGRRHGGRGHRHGFGRGFGHGHHRGFGHGGPRFGNHDADGFDPHSAHRDDPRHDRFGGEHGHGRRRDFGRSGHGRPEWAGAACGHEGPRHDGALHGARHHAAHAAEHAYQRGFDAGFDRGAGIR
ncbi:MarR family winged helix-turn-helix transcriptional regulator [Microbacterium sp. NPDC055903]